MSDFLSLSLTFLIWLRPLCVKFVLYIYNYWDFDFIDTFMMSRCLKNKKRFGRSVHKHLHSCTHCCTLCRYGQGHAKWRVWTPSPETNPSEKGRNMKNTIFVITPDTTQPRWGNWIILREGGAQTKSLFLRTTSSEEDCTSAEDNWDWQLPARGHCGFTRSVDHQKSAAVDDYCLLCIHSSSWLVLIHLESIVQVSRRKNLLLSCAAIISLLEYNYDFDPAILCGHLLGARILT